MVGEAGCGGRLCLVGRRVRDVGRGVGCRAAWALGRFWRAGFRVSALNVSGFIWGIADDVLRDVYVRGKYRDVILPMTVIRRLDAVLEPTKNDVLRMKDQLDDAGITNQDAALRQAAGEAFYNVSPFRLRDLTSRATQQQLRVDFEAYLDGFSPNVQEVLEKFKFRNQIPTLVEADALGFLIEKFLDSSINLSPRPVLNGDGSVRLAGLDNHGMGTVFEELIRRFNEENNEEAGEHFTPRDVVQLMARLVFLPIADEVKSGHLPGLRRRVRHGRDADRGGRDADAAGGRAEQGSFGSPVRTGGEPGDLRDQQGRSDPEGRRGRGGQHPVRVHAFQRRFPRQRVRLHAFESALRQELEDRPGAHGRQNEPLGSALHRGAPPTTQTTRWRRAPATGR